MAERPVALTTEELLRGLECPVCQEHYRDPRILKCGHTLCLKPCLEQIVAGKQSFKCPECRTQHNVPFGGIGSILKNVALSRQLDVRPETSTSDKKSSNCPICGEDDDLRKCGHCQVLMCLDCVNEHVPLYRKLLKRKAVAMLQEAAGVITKFSKDTELELSLRHNVEQVVKQIDEAEERAINLITSKAASLRKDVQSTHQSHLMDIASKKNSLADEWVHFASCCREDEKALCDSDDTLPTTKLRKISERLSKVPKHTKQGRDGIDNYDCKDFVTDFQCLQQAVDKCFTLHNRANKSVHALTQNPCESVGAVSQPVDFDFLSKDMSQVIQTFRTPTDSIPLRGPQAIDVDDKTGDVVVADTNNNRILKFDSRGKLVVCFGSGGSGPDQFHCPRDIVVNDESQMIVCDNGNQRIKIHNSDGALHSVLGVNVSGSKMFNDPRGIALDGDGNIHVCDDHQVQVVTQRGARVCRYRITDGRKPWRISITEDGKICILSSMYPVKHMNILDEHHKPVTSWEVPWGSCDLCVTRDHVLVCDGNTSKVHVYDYKGKEVKVFDGSKVAGCQRTRGLVLDRQGNVYVAFEDAVIKF